jgi:AcrB/AcrD/AcrF family
MRLSHFFISRPIFAIVLSLFVTIVGAVAYFALPVAHYPEVAPPTIQVTASYPGASAEVLSNCVVPRRFGQSRHVSAARQPSIKRCEIAKRDSQPAQTGRQPWSDFVRQRDPCAGCA